MSSDLKCQMNHVALSVENLDAAVDWYKSVFGFQEIIPSSLMSRKQDPDQVVFRVYGAELHEVKVAYLATGPKTQEIGFEIFEFVSPPYRGPTTACPSAFDHQVWTRGGFFHIALTTVEPDKLAEEVVQAGGMKVGETVTLPNGETANYVQDPWGNIIEICSTDFRSLITSR